MDYRMYSGGVPAGENVVTLIKESLKTTQNIKVNGPLKFVGFEGEAGTAFRLNGHAEETVIPSCGKFITPYNGERYMSIFELIFTQNFDGNIYYII